MRRTAREIVFKTLYSGLFNPDEDQLLNALGVEEKLSKNDMDFANKLFSTITEHRTELEDIISSLAKNYKLERIFPTDKCALLIGLCEIKYFDDVPNIVAIDEALYLCRVYSTAQSLSFVNGIFAEFKKQIEGV